MAILRASRAIPTRLPYSPNPAPIASPALVSPRRGAAKVCWLVLGLLILISAGTPGCTSSNDKKDFYLPSTHEQVLPPRSGSIAELSGKAEAKKRQKEKESLEAKSRVLVLVNYDAKGKPTLVTLRRSCGNGATDSRALEYVYKHRTFPSGRADMTVVEVDPRDIPKPKAAK